MNRVLLDTLEGYKEAKLVRSQNHPSLPLTIWNYTQKTQYEQKWDNVTLMCRGLILDRDGNIIARPFKKFFNIEEGRHTPTQKFSVYEKMDGSLGIVFHYEGKWRIATRGSFTSDQAEKGAELLKRYNLEKLNPLYTYMFEIIYPENRIVVNYGDTEDLVMLGKVCIKTGVSFDVDDYIKHGFNVVRRYDSVEDYGELKQRISDNAEGFVVVFKNGSRVKIKGTEYCRLHKIMTEVSTTSIWKSLLEDDDIEKLLEGVPDEYFYKIKNYRTGLLQYYRTLEEFINTRYEKINEELGPCDDKTFALHVKDSNYRSYYFALRNRKDISKMLWNDVKPEYRKL